MVYNLARLAEPFPPQDIEWRVQMHGATKDGRPWAMVLAYVTNRAIQARLDEVFGPLNWQNQFAPGPEGGIICGIGARSEDGWVWKWDGAENTATEPIKGGLSGSMKRAGVQWGIGRYLYNLDACFAECSTDRQNGQEWAKVFLDAKEKNNKTGASLTYWWRTPDLPVWAMPAKLKG